MTNLKELTPREQAILRAARKAEPKALSFVSPELQEEAIGLERMGLLAIYERGHSSGELFAYITEAGRLALSTNGGTNAR